MVGTEAGSSQLALNAACDCHLDLIMSCFVTEKRWDASDASEAVYELHHRHSRFDVLVFTLRTYAALPLERVYLYIELDRPFQRRRSELRRLVESLFGPRLITLQLRRLTTQHEWRHELAHTISPETRGEVGEQGDTRLVWFMQNDDHPFIDVNTDVLCEGLARMRMDRTSRFKSLYTSHWASALALSGKVHRPRRDGSYLVSRLTMLDSVQIHNFRFVVYLLASLDWKGRSYPRVDMLIRQRQVYDTAEVGAKSRLAHLFATSDSLQAFYVPLRELCRKFDAYVEMGIPPNVSRPLVLPHTANIATGTLTRDAARVHEMAMTPGRVLWTMESPFALPRAWADHAVALQLNAHARHEARRRLCSKELHPLLGLFDAAAAVFPAVAAAGCESVLGNRSGHYTCGERIEQLMQTAPALTRMQAEHIVAADFRAACGACGPCGGASCHAPAVMMREHPMANMRPMEPLRSVPRVGTKPWSRLRAVGVPK